VFVFVSIPLVAAVESRRATDHFLGILPGTVRLPSSSPPSRPGFLVSDFDDKHSSDLRVAGRCRFSDHLPIANKVEDHVWLRICLRAPGLSWCKRQTSTDTAQMCTPDQTLMMREQRAPPQKVHSEWFVLTTYFILDRGNLGQNSDSLALPTGGCREPRPMITKEVVKEDQALCGGKAPPCAEKGFQQPASIVSRK
jgi:hypothetical protein